MTFARKNFLLASWLLLMLVTGSVFAQPIPNPAITLRIAPSAPIAGDAVTLVIEFGDCAVPTAGTESVSIAGNVVMFTHLVPFPVCGVPPPGPQIGYPIGTFAPGNYTLLYAPTGDIPGSTWATTQFGFSVGAASVPAMSRGAGVWLLIAALALVALVRIALRREGP